MNFGSDRVSIEIEKVDGGFVLDWNKPKKRDPIKESMGGVWPSVQDPPTNGREIITDGKKLARRVNDFFGVTK